MSCPICGRMTFQSNGKIKCIKFPLCNYVERIKEVSSEDTFIIFDFETSGLGEDAKIIEVAAIKVKNGEIIDIFNMDNIPIEEKLEKIKDDKYETSVLVYPEMNVNARITAITGITNEMLRGRPTEDTVIPAFLEFSKDVDFVMGHNIISFDLRVLKATCRRLKIKMPFTTAIDTLHMARKIHPKGSIENHKQETLAKYYGIQYRAHRAYDDIEALLKIYNCLKNESSENFKEEITK